jgi:hypothetical protein
VPGRVVVLCRRIRHCHWRGDQFSGARDVGLAGGAGEQPVVTDAMEPFWQYVEEKAPNELERHLDDADVGILFEQVGGHLNALRAVDVEQRRALLNVIWGAAAGEPPQNWK